MSTAHTFIGAGGVFGGAVHGSKWAHKNVAYRPPVEFISRFLASSGPVINSHEKANAYDPGTDGSIEVDGPVRVSFLGPAICTDLNSALGDPITEDVKSHDPTWTSYIIEDASTEFLSRVVPTGFAYSESIEVGKVHSVK